jgi:hypothetical protein
MKSRTAENITPQGERSQISSSTLLLLVAGGLITGLATAAGCVGSEPTPVSTDAGSGSSSGSSSNSSSGSSSSSSSSSGSSSSGSGSSSGCVAPGSTCTTTPDCCQSGTGIPQGATCISNDNECHAICNIVWPSECNSNCCAAVNGESYGVCAASTDCACAQNTTPNDCAPGRVKCGDSSATTCCLSSQPYYCANNNTCYASEAEAYAECPASCVACNTN